MDAFGFVAALARQPFRIARFAVDTAETVYRTLADRQDAGPQEPRRREPHSPPRPRPAARRPVRRPAKRPAPRPAPAVPPEAKAVDDEPVLVAEFAGQGAEEPAGPEIHVDEPLPGYSLLKAADLVERLRAATAEEAAAIELYEGATKGRATVMSAAEMRLAELAPAPRAVT